MSKITYREVREWCDKKVKEMRYHSPEPLRVIAIAEFAGEGLTDETYLIIYDAAKDAFLEGQE